MSIESGKIIKGSLPNKATKLIKEWIDVHQEELNQDWILAQNFEPLEKIQGADND